MKREIKEYILEILPYNTVEMPVGAKILTVQSQYDVPRIWVEVDTDQYLVEYNFVTFEAGTVISNDFTGTYIGTYQVGLGTNVYHLYLI